MAMENKRITQLSTERLTLTSGDYVMVDDEDNGSAKYRLDRLKETDTTLSVSGKAADAAATGQAISNEAEARDNADTALGQAISAETTARGNAVTAEAQAREAADTALGRDVDDLKSALRQSDNELFRVSGYLNQNYVKGRQRYVDSGVEKFANNSKWISPAQGEYIELKSGDVIISHSDQSHNRYNFRVCYSTDNKTTFTMSPEQTSMFVMPSDAVGWISLVITTTATDDDVETILNGHIIEILRNGVNQVGKAISTANGIMNVLEINPNSGFSIEAIKNGTTFNYVNTTATENGGNEKLFEIPCAKGDVFRLTFDFQAMVSPENFNDYYLMVREIDQREASPLRNVKFKLSELQTAVDFTVYCANTKKIIANVNLKRSSTTVSTGYYEEIKYSVTMIKVLEQNDVYTEAGDTWEV